MPDPALAPGAVDVWQGQPGLRLCLANGDSAWVSLHGGQVLSWVAGGRERLYLSPQARFDGQSALRGGIPLCFPQFNQRGPLPKHGFARNLPWQVDALPTGQATQTLRLSLHDSERSRVWWPERFAVQLAVVLAPGCLQIDLAVHNPGPSAWDFTTALHTYLAVDDIAQVRVQGLDDCARWDALADRQGVQQGDIAFAGEYDSVFQAASAPVRLQDGGQGLEIAQSASLGQTVVWNPGPDLCARLPDLPATGYQHLLCIEAAQIDQPVSLSPGARWTGGQHLRVL
ncbi:MAG: D-hexose-6-phosphate mutarotase [Burkholderiaceae bacterium]|nr:D-hexose-6-phosphate mutarotase [Burkholderiaceae bacterium]